MLKMLRAFGHPVQHMSQHHRTFSTKPLETPKTIEKCTTSGGRTKANERSFVLVHQHGGDDVTWKPSILNKNNGNENVTPKIQLSAIASISRLFRLVHIVQYGQTILELDGYERFKSKNRNWMAHCCILTMSSKTWNLVISRCCIVEYHKEMQGNSCCICSTSILLFQPIKYSLCGVIVAFAVARSRLRDSRKSANMRKRVWVFAWEFPRVSCFRVPFLLVPTLLSETLEQATFAVVFA